MPYVVNRHHYRSGKAPNKPPLPADALYIGRGTALGNPVTIQECPDVATNLAAYRRHLWCLLQTGDSATIEMMERISEDTALVCSCAPRPCHGDVVVAAWEWWRAHRA